MTTSSSPSNLPRRRRGGGGGVLSSTAASVAALALILSAAAPGPAAAQWVVETNSLRILEPSFVAGRHDAAIGDVRFFFLTFRLVSFFLFSFFFSTSSPSSSSSSCSSSSPFSPQPQFGVPLYGATLTGEIRHVKVDACKPFPKDAVEALKGSSASSLSPPVIALVDRGDCFFIEKAFNAEKAGAAALIVADDRDEALVTMVRLMFLSFFY